MQPDPIPAAERPTSVRRCGYCGETDAWPRELCIERLIGNRGPNPAPFECPYSVEGIERCNAEMAAASRPDAAQTEGGGRGRE